MNSSRALQLNTLILFVLFCIALPILPFAVHAQQVDMIDVSELSLEDLLLIKVDVGSRGKLRTAFNSPVPIDIVTAEDLRATGSDELTEALSRLIPSMNSTRPSVSDGSDHVFPITLRGLGTDQMLVLVNGKRRHHSALVHITWGLGRGSTSIDLNAIPIAAVDRVEILRDGAAAQYGSDAISGIINIVLKSEQESDFSTRFRQTREGDGQSLVFTSRIGFNLPHEGVISFVAQFRDREATNRSAPRFDWTEGNAVLNGKKIYRYGDADARDLNFLGNLDLNLGAGIKFYSFFNYDFRLGEAGGFYRAPQDKRNLPELYPQGYLPLISPDISDFSGTVGFRGKVNGWRVDMSNTYGRSQYHYFVENSLNASVGPTSQTMFDCGQLLFCQNTTNLDVFKAIDVKILKYPLNIGAGTELRLEGFRIIAGEENSYLDGGYQGRTPGAQVFPGFQPGNETDRNRNSFAFYIDLENNITANLMVCAAGRYENYSDFGETWNSKLSLRYEPIPFFILRASTSSGFRAPSLGQSFFTATATTFINGAALQVGNFSVDHPLSKAHGARPLKPERSVHLSGGFALQPSRNLSLSLDYFLVDISDRVTLSGTFTPSNSSEQIRELLLEHGVGGARFFTNAVDTRSYGMDLVAKLQHDLNKSGTLLLSLGIHANRTKIIGDVKIPDIISASETTRLIFFDQIHRYHVEKVNPALNINISAAYRLKRWTFTLRTIRFGAFSEAFHETDPVKTQNLSAKWITDLDVMFRLNDSLSVSAGANNIFDVYPDRYNVDAYSSGVYFPYSRFSPFGFNGATCYLKLRYGFH